MSIPPYSLSCSVCQGVYISKTEWLDHLTTPKHLISARDDIVDECKTEQNGIKECCLLVFSNTPLTLSSGGGAEKLIRYFSSDPTTFVTDFVWWGDRPRFGILQFESRKKALELHGGCTKLLIDGTAAEVKWAGGLSKVEWRAYLPEGDAGEGSTPRTGTSAANNEKENCKPNSSGDRSADSSLIRDDTAHQDDQVTEISVSSKPKKSEKPKKAIIRLRRFARRQLGSKPQFVYHSLLNNPHGKHLYSVIINDEKYKPSARAAAGESKMDAKSKAARFTLKKLRLATASKKLKENRAGAGRRTSVQDHPSPTENETKAPKRRLESDDEIQLIEEVKIESRQPPKKLKTCANVPASGPGGKSPISLLNELTQRNKWPAPVYKCQKEGKGAASMFSYSVKVNGVMYKPNLSIPKVATMKEAKRLIAEFCLKKLTSSMRPAADSESAVKSKAATNLKLALKDTSIQNSNLSSVPDSLKNELQCVKNIVTISDAEFRVALEAVHALKSLFITKDRTSQVAIFRNWHLKLRNPNCSENHKLLVYVYKTRPLTHVPHSFTGCHTAVQRVFRMPTAKKSFELLEEAISGSSSKEAALQKLKGWEVKFKPYNLSFRLIADRKFFVEVQICRLVEYMCTFDPVCHSLLKLAYYWTTSNRVTIGEFDGTHLSLPEPHAVEWLVIVFLCQKGILPTPRQIQERPHKLLKERRDGPDIGFHADPAFVKEWKSKRNIKSGQSMNEVELFQQFLHFYGETLNNGSWIINTRDGEVLPMSSFLACEPNKKSMSSLQTKMSLEEFRKLRRSLQQKPVLSTDETSTGTAQGNMPNCAYKVNFNQWTLFMVHPFKFSWKFSMSKDVKNALNLMKSTGRQLKAYLKMRKHNGVKEAKKRFGSLEKVLKVVDE